MSTKIQIKLDHSSSTRPQNKEPRCICGDTNSPLTFLGAVFFFLGAACTKNSTTVGKMVRTRDIKREPAEHINGTNSQCMNVRSSPSSSWGQPSSLGRPSSVFTLDLKDETRGRVIHGEIRTWVWHALPAGSFGQQIIQTPWPVSPIEADSRRGPS